MVAGRDSLSRIWFGLIHRAGCARGVREGLGRLLAEELCFLMEPQVYPCIPPSHLYPVAGRVRNLFRNLASTKNVHVAVFSAYVGYVAHS